MNKAIPELLIPTDNIAVKSERIGNDNHVNDDDVPPLSEPTTADINRGDNDSQSNIKVEISNDIINCLPAIYPDCIPEPPSPPPGSTATPSKTTSPIRPIIPPPNATVAPVLSRPAPTRAPPVIPAPAIKPAAYAYRAHHALQSNHSTSPPKPTPQYYDGPPPLQSMPMDVDDNSDINIKRERTSTNQNVSSSSTSPLKKFNRGGVAQPLIPAPHYHKHTGAIPPPSHAAMPPSMYHPYHYPMHYHHPGAPPNVGPPPPPYHHMYGGYPGAPPPPPPPPTNGHDVNTHPPYGYPPHPYYVNSGLPLPPSMGGHMSTPNGIPPLSAGSTSRTKLESSSNEEDDSDDDEEDNDESTPKSGNRQYQCDLCGFVFNRKRELVNHRRKHTGEKPFECVTCHKKYRTRSSLRGHEAIHSQRAYSCHICGNAFHRKSKLDRHMISHSDARPHSCPICFKGFKRSDHLNAHMKAVHKILDKRSTAAGRAELARQPINIATPVSNALRPMPPAIIPIAAAQRTKIEGASLPLPPPLSAVNTPRAQSHRIAPLIPTHPTHSDRKPVTAALNLPQLSSNDPSMIGPPPLE